jgi:hypothetical protein
LEGLLPEKTQYGMIAADQNGITEWSGKDDRPKKTAVFGSKTQQDLSVHQRCRNKLLMVLL